MELTLGEFQVLIETLEKSLSFVNWNGFTRETRRSVYDKIMNAQDLKIELTVDYNHSSKSEDEQLPRS